MTLESFYKQYANTPIDIRNIKIKDFTLANIYAELRFLNEKKEFMLDRAAEAYDFLKEKPPTF